MINDDPTDQVLSVIHAVYDNWAAGDADAFAELYTDDATVVQPGVHKKNKGEIQTTMAAAFAGPLKGSRVLDEPQSVRFLGPDTAVVRAPTSALTQVAGVRADIAMPNEPKSIDAMVRPVAVDASGAPLPELAVSPNLVRVQARFVAGTPSR